MSRIIAGSAGGRRLRTPAGQVTRPTTDRVREAVFSALAAWNGTASQPPAEQLAGQGFLDLFAGSGAVGLEAASRGADPVVCVDRDRLARQAITANITATGCRARVVGESVSGFLAGRARGTEEDGAGRFDIVWFDPPYDLPDDQLDDLVAQAAREVLVDDGLMVVERSSRSERPTFPAGFTSWESGYGETVVHYAQRESGSHQ